MSTLYGFFASSGRRTFLAILVLALCQQSLAQPASSGQPAAESPADLVLTGGNIITMDAQRPRAEAIASRGGRIAAVGSAADIRQQIGPQTRVIELQGRTVIPGFIEGHGHFTGLGEAKQNLDLTKAESWDAIVEMVRAAAQRTPPGEWIIGRGWHQEKWAQSPQPSVEGLPVHTSLSAATPRHPVLLTHASGHMAFANARAMEMAGITVQTLDPEGGQIVRDMGAATGALRETAQRLVSRVRDESSQRSVDRSIELATAECLKNGITSFHDAGSSLAVVGRFRELADQGKLGLRLWVMVRDDNARMREQLPRARVIGAGNGFLTVRAVKKTLDGALGSHGAWLLSEYADKRDSTGLQTVSLASVKETAEIAVANDMQLCIHAIGDRANREVLNLYEATFKAHPSAASRRWRVEHAQHLHSDDIPRFGKLGVIASMQGCHCTSDAVFVPQRLGDERSREGAYVWQSLLKSGAIICNGTDAPVEDVSALRSFYASVTRRLADGTVFYPEQRMTREQALRSYTLDAAYAAFEEDVKGSLSAGKLADMTVLSRDILMCTDEEILTTQVIHTIVGGKVAFTNEAATEPAAATPRPPVKLTDAALALHRSALLIDGHNDLPWSLRSKEGGFNTFDIAKRQSTGHTDIPRLREGGVGAQFWSVYVPNRLAYNGTAMATTVEQIELVKLMIERYPGDFALALSTDDIRRIRGEGKIASLIGVEGGYSIEDSLANLRRLYELGARYMTLTHSDSLSWADSATDEPISNGLSPFGEDVVRDMNRLGMLVDLSHVSPTVMKHAIRVSQAPVIFSHSSARGVADHPRNVPDDVLKLLPEKDGVVMVNFFSGFIVPEAAASSDAQLRPSRRRGAPAGERGGDSKADAEAEANAQAERRQRQRRNIPRGTIHVLLDHIDHIAKTAGHKHVGIGSDYDGVSVLPEQLDDVSYYPYITQGLLDRGYTPDQIRGILGENLMRVFRGAEEAAKQLAAGK